MAFDYSNECMFQLNLHVLNKDKAIYGFFRISLFFLTPGLKLLLIGSQSKGYSSGEFPKEATYWGFDPLTTFNIVCTTREQLASSFTLQKQKR